MTFLVLLVLVVGLWCALSYQGSVMRTGWLMLNLNDTYRALRTVRPNGRRIGAITRRKAMRDSLISWIVLIVVQYASSPVEKLFGWLPFYTVVKVILTSAFLITRAASSNAVYDSMLSPLVKRYETPIDLTCLLFHSVAMLVYHYGFQLPLGIVQKAIKSIPSETFATVNLLIKLQLTSTEPVLTVDALPPDGNTVAFQVVTSSTAGFVTPQDHTVLLNGSRPRPVSPVTPKKVFPNDLPSPPKALPSPPPSPIRTPRRMNVNFTGNLQIPPAPGPRRSPRRPQRSNDPILSTTVVTRPEEYPLSAGKILVLPSVDHTEAVGRTGPSISVSKALSRPKIRASAPSVRSANISTAVPLNLSKRTLPGKQAIPTAFDLSSSDTFVFKSVPAQIGKSSPPTTLPASLAYPPPAPRKPPRVIPSKFVTGLTHLERSRLPESNTLSISERSSITRPLESKASSSQIYPALPTLLRPQPINPQPTVRSK